MKEIKVALTVDARGLVCPMPIVRAKQGIGKIEIGDVMEVLATDPGSMPDFRAWARATGHELLEAEESDAAFRFCIRRSK